MRACLSCNWRRCRLSGVAQHVAWQQEKRAASCFYLELSARSLAARCPVRSTRCWMVIVVHLPASSHPVVPRPSMHPPAATERDHKYHGRLTPTRPAQCRSPPFFLDCLIYIQTAELSRTSSRRVRVGDERALRVQPRTRVILFRHQACMKLKRTSRKRGAHLQAISLLSKLAKR
jgi:hypothetical protein